MKSLALIGAQVSTVEVVDNAIPSDGGVVSVIKLVIQLAIALVPYWLQNRKEKKNNNNTKL